MLIFWRTFLFVAFLGVISMAIENAMLHPDTGDLWNAGLLGILLILSILNAIVWAPWVGDVVAGPLTFMYTGRANEEVVEDRWIIRWIRYWDLRGHRRTVVHYCFVAGLLHPRMPTPFILGLKNSELGSRWEKFFARRVYYFNNAHACLQAYEVLARNGVRPPVHPNPEVRRFLRRFMPREQVERKPIKAPKVEPVSAIRRNPRIRLFAGADRAGLPDGKSDNFLATPAPRPRLEHHEHADDQEPKLDRLELPAHPAADVRDRVAFPGERRRQAAERPSDSGG